MGNINYKLFYVLLYNNPVPNGFVKSEVFIFELNTLIFYRSKIHTPTKK